MRTRFAPSPTGFLHVGGLRTALFSYLLAKQTGGSFLLRIEDTDKARTVEGAVENILRTLHWAGIAPDEGVVLDRGVPVQKGERGPYIQSERLDIYRVHVERLLEAGHVYPCFCNPERLEQLHEEQKACKGPLLYDRLCLALSEEEREKRLARGDPHVLRLKIPQDQVIAFDDDIRGRVEFRGHLIDDQVLLKTDGYPTYHLAHVVDDHLMSIDMVIRGEEWLSSLPKHLVLFRAFGWTPPRYAHVPLLLNKDRTKLSKRQGDVAVEAYRERGYLPEALVNFIALLGWNPGTSRALPSGTGHRPSSEKEVFSLEELIEQFSIDRVQKGGAIFDTDKLEWLQGQWMRKMTLEEFADRIRPIVAQYSPGAQGDPRFLEKSALIRERITFLREAPEMMEFFYQSPHVDANVLTNAKQGVTHSLLPSLLNTLLTTLIDLPEDQWQKDMIFSSLNRTAENGGLKRGQLLWPLRAALTGKPFSPGATEVAEVLGKQETVRRLERVMEIL